MTDAFLEQDTVLVLKHGLLDTYKIVEGIYLSWRVFAASAVIEVFSSR